MIEQALLIAYSCLDVDIREYEVPGFNDRVLIVIKDFPNATCIGKVVESQRTGSCLHYRIDIEESHGPIKHHIYQGNLWVNDYEIKEIL
jgi:hypothetical protein